MATQQKVYSNVDIKSIQVDLTANIAFKTVTYSWLPDRTLIVEYYIDNPQVNATAEFNKLDQAVTASIANVSVGLGGTNTSSSSEDPGIISSTISYITNFFSNLFG